MQWSDEPYGGFTESDDPAHSWSPPNITGDPETGRLGKMTEDQFVAKLQQAQALGGKVEHLICVDAAPHGTLGLRLGFRPARAAQHV